MSRITKRVNKKRTTWSRDRSRCTTKFADLVDAGVPPTTALERVAKMRASAASA